MQPHLSSSSLGDCGSYQRNYMSQLEGGDAPQPNVDDGRIRANIMANDSGDVVDVRDMEIPSNDGPAACLRRRTVSLLRIEFDSGARGGGTGLLQGYSRLMKPTWHSFNTWGRARIMKFCFNYSKL